MTTFQALVETILQGITSALPFSPKLDDVLTQNLLEWNIPQDGLTLLVHLMASLAFLIFFRYDWLGLASALIRSITDPKSLGEERRNLDQHTLIFMLCVLVPFLLAQQFLSPMLQRIEFFNHPMVFLMLSLGLAFVFRFSYRWNKRIHGLNHLKMKDTLVVASLSLLSLHPSLPLLGLFWIGFALTNYHYEAIFKYSFLLMAIVLFIQTFFLFDSIGVTGAIFEVGRLNSIAVVVVAFTIFWMTLENLQKNMGEATFRAFQWLSGLVGIFFISMAWLRG